MTDYECSELSLPFCPFDCPPLTRLFNSKLHMSVERTKYTRGISRGKISIPLRMTEQLFIYLFCGRYRLKDHRLDETLFHCLYSEWGSDGSPSTCFSFVSLATERRKKGGEFSRSLARSFVGSFGWIDPLSFFLSLARLHSEMRKRLLYFSPSPATRIVHLYQLSSKGYC